MAMLPVALIVGILAGIWAYVSPIIGVITWPAFIAWAFFYVAGGQTRLLPKVAVPLLSGVLLGLFVATVGSQFGSVGGAVAVFLIATAIVLMGSHPLFALAAAQFGGAASFFGTGADFVGTLVALACGLILGVLSVELPALLLPKKAEPEAESAAAAGR